MNPNLEQYIQQHREEFDGEDPSPDTWQKLQEKLDGRPDEPDRHETQYFEMFGNRGIYHKGWTAVTRHKTPWLLVGEQAPAFDDDVWELYDTSVDWTQFEDVSAQHPDRLLLGSNAMWAGTRFSCFAGFVEASHRQVGVGPHPAGAGGDGRVQADRHGHRVLRQLRHERHAEACARGVEGRARPHRGR